MPKQPPVPTIGDFLDARFLRPSEAARAAGLPKSMLYNWVYGKVRDPYNAHAQKFADAFGLSLTVVYRMIHAAYDAAHPVTQQPDPPPRFAIAV